jgi:hypothetical protein
MHLADAMAPEVLVPVHTFEAMGIRSYLVGTWFGGRMAMVGRLIMCNTASNKGI